MSTRRLAALLALLELAIAVYLEVERARGSAVSCPIGGGGCEKVQESSYSELAGIPLPILGLIGAATMLVTTLLGDPRARTAAFVLAVAGALFSLYLAGLQALRDQCLLRLVPVERGDLDRARRHDRHRPGSARPATNDARALALAGADRAAGAARRARPPTRSSGLRARRVATSCWRRLPGTHAGVTCRWARTSCCERDRRARRRGARPAGRPCAEARRAAARGRARARPSLTVLRDRDRRAGSARRRRG